MTALPRSSPAPASLFATFVATALAATTLVAATPRTAHAQDIVMPIVGRQFGTWGFALNPGVLYDGDAPDRVGVGPASVTAAPMVRLGIHHIVSTQFSMSGELELGAQWASKHTATPDEVSGPEAGFALQAAVLGRYFPLGEPRGWTFAAGPHYFRTWLPDAPLQVFGFDLRVGRFFWTDDERFLIVELGYALPFIQGLSLAPDFDADSPQERYERTWTFHRLSIGVSLTW